MNEYLASLQMTLTHQSFDAVGLQRIVQLINKTNQFNLTTKRYTEDEVKALIDDPDALTLQLRMTDLFADNGMIGVVIGRRDRQAPQVIRLDAWLMSCRVLGRRVEQATLEVIALAAERMGATTVVGQFIPSAKNAMVADHYQKLGFSELEGDQTRPDSTFWALNLSSRPKTAVPLTIVGASA
jgi:FkbH-like protein